MKKLHYRDEVKVLFVLTKSNLHDNLREKGSDDHAKTAKG